MRSTTVRGMVCVGLWLLASSAHAYCYNAGQVCKWKRNAAGGRTVPDTSCTKLPTTLYIVNLDSPTEDDGWSGGTGLCGFNYGTNGPCGDYFLSSYVCGPGVETGNPFPGDGDPCDPSSANYDPAACGAGGGPFENLTKGAGKPSPAPLSSGAEAVAQHLKSLATRPLPPHVAEAVEALGAAPSFHLRARITLTSENTGQRPVAGVYEYWEKDGKYRMHFGIDVAEAPVSEIAYDGREYQMALAKDSLLSVAAADERAVPAGIPNPLFLVLQPLAVDTADCLGCVLRLSDLRALRDLRHAAAPEAASPAPLQTPGSNVKVTLTPSGDPAATVWSREQDGVVRVERVEFSDYRAIEGRGINMPRSIKLLRTIKTGSSLSHVTIIYQIDDLELGSDIDDSVFTLDRSGFKRIWAGDRKQFIKGTPCPASKD